MNQLHSKGVVILDFGSQYTQLIARKVRELNVYSEVLSPDTSLDKIKQCDPSAIILSGGPSSVFADEAPNFDKNIFNIDVPILGICYGLQLLAHHHGGSVESNGQGEYGFAEINIDDDRKLFQNVSKCSQVWMSHMDRVIKIPDGWHALAHSSNGVIAAMSNEDQSIVATQFHPEVSHTEEGKLFLNNFLFKIANCSPNWTAENFIEEQIEIIRNQVKDDKVIVGVSGGVDSTVVAALLHKAIGDQSTAILIDHGMLRLNEATNCVKALKDGLGVNIHCYDESEIFLKKLEGVTDPEKKRKIIGNQFIYSFDKIANELGDIKYVSQGTLYPDIIESGVSKGKSAHVIKSHHNVGGLPDDMNFQLIEPLRELFKDEVRNIGRELGLPNALINRHPFPGPGLAVRIIGEITKERIDILQKADQVYIDILYEDDLYDDIWQAFAVILPVKTVGVMGDSRTYDYVCALRAVTSIDGMTADYYPFEHEFLSETATKIINNVNGINRVTYDITSKPPGTIEWE